MIRVAIFLVVLALLPSVAHAQKRVALVIGNSAYQHTPKLTNPKNDATDMIAALKKHGFQVLEGFDLDKAAFERKVRDFATALSSAQVGVFFYAGHGLQVAGQNYLCPSTRNYPPPPPSISRWCGSNWCTARWSGRRRPTFCSSTPVATTLARNLARAMGTRSTEIGRGLAQVESGVGTLISFSTQPGNVALDGTGRNSPFAGALVKQLATSNDDLSAILIGVRNDVMKETQRKQVPWEHSALTGRFYFNAKPQEKPASLATTPQEASDAARTWATVKDTTDLSILEAYIKQFDDTVYGAVARARLKELKAAAACGRQTRLRSGARQRPSHPWMHRAHSPKSERRQRL